jgi:hypothetical protein
LTPPLPLRRRELQLKLEEDRRRLVEAINAAFGNLGSAARSLLTERDKLLAAVGGLSLLALGVYSGEGEGSGRLPAWLMRLSESGVPASHAGCSAGDTPPRPVQAKRACSGANRSSNQCTSVQAITSRRRRCAPFPPAAREGTRSAAKAFDRWFGTPRLVRETSRRPLLGRGAAPVEKSVEEVKRDFSDIVLEPRLQVSSTGGAGVWGKEPTAAAGGRGVC